MAYAAAQQVARHHHLTYMGENVVRSDASGVFYIIDARRDREWIDDFIATPAAYMDGVGWVTLEFMTGCIGRYDDVCVLAKDTDTLAERIYAAR